MRVAVAAIVFVVVYPFVSFLAMLSVIGTEGMALHRNAFVSYGGGWAVLYFVAGVLILGISGLRDANLGLGVLAFAIGGLAGGLTIATMLASGVLGGPLSVMISFAIPFTLPWIVATGLCLLLGVHRFSRSQEESSSQHQTIH